MRGRRLLSSPAKSSLERKSHLRQQWQSQLGPAWSQQPRQAGSRALPHGTRGQYDLPCLCVRVHVHTHAYTPSPCASPPPSRLLRVSPCTGRFPQVHGKCMLRKTMCGLCKLPIPKRNFCVAPQPRAQALPQGPLHGPPAPVPVPAPLPPPPGPSLQGPGVPERKQEGGGRRAGEML